jgi:serine/threonine protein kinase/tetratricopeptide (TPR) repeat protein
MVGGEPVGYDRIQIGQNGSLDRYGRRDMPMTPPALTAKAVFDQAHEIDSADERREYLDQACAGAPELRQKVEALLRAYDDAGSFMDMPVHGATASFHSGDDTPNADRLPPGDREAVANVQTAATQAPTAVGTPTTGPGTQIGPYRLVKALGEGGMGAVYLAEQEQPIRRQVALKLIKPGMDSAHVIARFEAERQALTMMDHVNIARVFDAGATASGQPFFVMELVQGVPLTRFCDKHRLPVRERLALFVTVCQAIQHAHQKGIMHRDIKPSNVLIAMQDGKPLAKVIDFGLAKATEQPLTEQTQLTQAGAILGTLKYMSPEQADFNTSGLDTRTDIYSLGVMLYELLTGTTPLDMESIRGEGLLDLVLRIKEDDPPRPSVGVAGLGKSLPAMAAERGTDPARLPKLLRGELDWIVMKAIEKDRNRRYETASGFAKDIDRYLADESVEACPPSTRYRLGKLVRRHRALFIGMAAVVGLLVIGVGGLTAAIVRENHLRHRAQTAEHDAEAGYELVRAGFEAINRGRNRLRGPDKLVLARALQRHAGFSPSLDDVEETREAIAARHFLLGDVHVLLGEDAPAEAEYREAIAMYEKLAKEFPGVVQHQYDLFRCRFTLGRLLLEQNKIADARDLFSRAVEGSQQLAEDDPDNPGYQRDLADALNNLGVLWRRDGDLPRAEKAYRRAAAIGDRLIHQYPDFEEYQINQAATCHNLGNAVRNQGDARAALDWYARAIALLDPMPDRPAIATEYLRNAHWDRAAALDRLGKHAEAAKDWQRAIDLDDSPAKPHLQRFLEAAQKEESLRADPKLTGPALYNAASLNALAMAAAAKVEEPLLEERYGKRSLELLKQAREAGWFNDRQHIQQLRDDLTFGTLPRESFVPFVESLESSPKATPTGK